MKFEETLLALIAPAPCSGYDLGRWLATEGKFLRANADQSQIYKTLNRLVKNGYIEFTVEEREGAPNAKVYRLTQQGAEHLRAVSESEYVPPARWQEPDFAARLTCLVPLNPPTVLPLIETEAAFRKEQIRRFRNRDRSVRLEPGRFATTLNSCPNSSTGCTPTTRPTPMPGLPGWRPSTGNGQTTWMPRSSVPLHSAQGTEG